MIFAWYRREFCTDILNGLMHPESRHPWYIMILHSNDIIFTPAPSFHSILSGQSDILLGWYLQRYGTKSSLLQSSTSLGDSWGVSFVVVPCQFIYYEIDFIWIYFVVYLIDDSWDSIFTRSLTRHTMPSLEMIHTIRHFLIQQFIIRCT